MINILYLHSSAEMYGADKVLLELLKGLDKTKFYPIVVLPCQGVLYDMLLQEGIECIVVPYPILRRQYFNPRGIIKYIKDYFKYSKEIVNFSRNREIDILHINTTAVLEGVYLKSKLNIPLIWHVHEILLNPKIIFQFISFIIGKYADKVIVVSEATRNHLMKSIFIKEGKVKTIYNGVDNSVYHNNYSIDYLYSEFKLPKSCFVIGMIGRVNAWKGQYDLLEAATSILAQNEDVYLILIGGVFEGQEWRMEELINKVNSMPQKNRIILHDFRNDTPQLYNLFDIFVLPSTNPDPLPTVVLEAMACSRAVVGYRHGGVCEMVVDMETGLLANPGDIQDLSNKISLLVEKREKTKVMGVKAKNRQQKYFSLNNYIQRFSDLYNKTIE